MAHSHAHNDRNHHHDDIQHSFLEEDAQREEQAHFQKVIEAFAFYPLYAQRRLERTADNFYHLSDRHKALVPHMEEKLKRWKQCLEANTDFIEMVLSNRVFVDEHWELPPRHKRPMASDFNMDKVCSTIRQFNREWGSEGAEERNSSYGILLQELEKAVPVDKENLFQKKVLCPGSGLGRLPFEICKRGYCSQGNEYSYFMLITGNFILNSTKKVGEFTIFPFIHQISNVMHWEDQFRAIQIPDVNPSDLPPNADFSYTAGDFVEVYAAKKDVWDAVVTSFFLDTANNIIQFVEVIYGIIKPGGYWLNLGPLLYHYAEMLHEQSIELTQAELIHVVEKTGFIIEKQSWHNTTYAGNPKSMMTIAYNAAFFLARKPAA